MLGFSNNLIPTEPLGMDLFLYLPFYSPLPSFFFPCFPLVNNQQKCSILLHYSDSLSVWIESFFPVVQDSLSMPISI